MVVEQEGGWREQGLSFKVATAWRQWASVCAMLWVNVFASFYVLFIIIQYYYSVSYAMYNFPCFSFKNMKQTVTLPHLHCFFPSHTKKNNPFTSIKMSYRDCIKNQTLLSIFYVILRVHHVSVIKTRNSNKKLLKYENQAFSLCCSLS